MIWFRMKRSTSVLIYLIFCAKRFYELIQGHAFLFAASFQGFWSSKEFIHLTRSLLTRSKVQSTFVHSMMKRKVRRESRRKVQHLLLVHTLPHPPMMRNWITLWYLSKTLAPRCPGLLLSCTITISVVIQSSLVSKPNWTKSRGS